MTEEKFFSIHDISKELRTGTATTKFILKRFESWFKPDMINGRPLFTREAIPLLLKIKDFLDAGKLPSEIDHALETDFFEAGGLPSLADHFLEEPNGDVRVSKDGLTLIKDLFSDISEQQRRIALAHEKRAEAEERKAAAIEKRADAEEKKATAMNNIAAALQEMNRHRTGADPETLAVAREAAKMIEVDAGTTSPDLPGEDEILKAPDFPDLFTDEDFSGLPDDGLQGEDEFNLSEEPDEFPELDELARSIDALDGYDNDAADVPVEAVEVDDLYELIEDKDADDLSDLLETPETESGGLIDNLDNLDDLDDLIDTVSDEPALEESDLADLEHLLDDIPLEPAAADLDDLSSLISDDGKEPDAASDLDDLGSLIETDEEETPASGDIGDLSQLLASPEEAPRLDDLYLLVDAPGEDLDDLSQLVAQPAVTENLDDLSALIEEDQKQDHLSLLIEAPREQDLDNLSALIEGPQELELDNLSALIEGPQEQDLDDLSALVGDTHDKELDDLAALIEPSDTAPQPVSPPPAESETRKPAPAETPHSSIKPDLSRDDDLQAYKTAVMKIIMKLKSDGLSAQEATDRLNRDQVQTISGKPQWSVKAMAQIYKFMDAAK